jgi:hypothetical protein
LEKVDTNTNPLVRLVDRYTRYPLRSMAVDPSVLSVVGYHLRV